MEKFAGKAAKTKKSAKLPVLGKFAKKTAIKLAKKKPASAEVEKEVEVEDGEFVGLSGRVADEAVYQIFGQVCKITKQTPDSLFLKAKDDYKL